MRKNLTAGIAGTRNFHFDLSIARGNPGRGSRFVPSTAGLQWMKRLSSKRVRRQLNGEMVASAAMDVEESPKRMAPAPHRTGDTGILVVTKRGGRTEHCVIAREERAFTSPSDNSLRLMGFNSLQECIESKAARRFEAC